MRTTGRDGGSTVQSVDRAVTILELLALHGQAGITQLAHELGVHKSTASRLVAALERRRLVEQVEERGRYRLGVGVLKLAGATSARLDLVQEARPAVRRLASETGETVNLAVLSGGAALYVDQVSGAANLSSYNWVGQHIPLHATSNGKVLVSELPGARADARPRGADRLHPVDGHRPRGPSTPSSPRSASAGGRWPPTSSTSASPRSPHRCATPTGTSSPR